MLKLGVYYAHSVKYRASLLHEVIANHHLDLMMVTETWLYGDMPLAITQDIAPTGYSVFHDFRPPGELAGGIAVICRSDLRCTSVQLLSARSLWRCLVVKVTGRNSRMNIAAVY